MKRSLLMSIMLILFLTVNAQTRGFVVTGNNVNLRTGPGKNYKVVVSLYHDERIRFNKGALLVDLGQKKNGFCKVSYFIHQEGDYEGWVSAKYLKPVRLCSYCGGCGYGANRFDTCTKCNGRGY
jgi:uncharacterized protein YgiM (DUF1202 family)